MASMAQRKLTAQEYLEIERASSVKHEFLDGQMLAMAGASYEHNVIVSNLNAELHAQLRGGSCRVVASDMRVKVGETGLYTYPNLVVHCGQPALEDDHLDTLINPTVIFEVLSPSTETYDRGKKFAHYRRLESLKEYVLVAQDAMRVEHFVRTHDGDWLLKDRSRADETVSLETIGCEVRLSDIYQGVTFHPTA